MHEDAQLAAIPEPKLERIKEDLRAQDKDVTVRSILTAVMQEKAEKIRGTRRAAFAAAPAPKGAYDYRIGRAHEVLADIKETPLILTDPPYEDAADPLYEWLADFASKVLIPGGSLIFFTGHHRLPRDFEIFKVLVGTLAKS
jgi:hypothetical protein